MNVPHRRRHGSKGQAWHQEQEQEAKHSQLHTQEESRNND